jgi:hypothetical protein
MSTPDELIAEVERAGQEYATWVETLTEEQFRRRPAPDEWTAAENTGHVSEAPLTFARHALRLAEEGGGLAGRPPTDPDRLAAVARLADRGPQEGAQLVREGIAEACAVLRRIPADAWGVMGEHSRMGQISVRGLVEASVRDHVRGHLRQAKEAAGA